MASEKSSYFTGEHPSIGRRLGKDRKARQQAVCAGATGRQVSRQVSRLKAEMRPGGGRLTRRHSPCPDLRLSVRLGKWERHSPPPGQPSALWGNPSCTASWLGTGWVGHRLGERGLSCDSLWGPARICGAQRGRGQPRPLGREGQSCPLGESLPWGPTLVREGPLLLLRPLHPPHCASLSVQSACAAPSRDWGPSQAMTQMITRRCAMWVSCPEQREAAWARYFP